jgi:hypothetical protein
MMAPLVVMIILRKRGTKRIEIVIKAEILSDIKT